MGDLCSVCFGTRDQEAKFYTTEYLDSNEWGDTREPNNIGNDDEKSTFDPKRDIKDERSYNLEDKVSESKISMAATPTKEKSECVYTPEDSKKSSSELENMLERKDTDELVSLALQNDYFVPGPKSAEANEKKMFIEDDLKYEEKLDTLLPESKSNRPKTERHIQNDRELIEQMLNSSDSPDSFACLQEESINRL